MDSSYRLQILSKRWNFFLFFSVFLVNHRGNDTAYAKKEQTETLSKSVINKVLMHDKLFLQNRRPTKALFPSRHGKVEIIARGLLLSQTFEALLAEFKTVQNLTSDFVE